MLVVSARSCQCVGAATGTPVSKPIPIPAPLPAPLSQQEVRFLKHLFDAVEEHQEDFGAAAIIPLTTLEALANNGEAIGDLDQARARVPFPPPTFVCVCVWSVWVGWG